MQGAEAPTTGAPVAEEPAAPDPLLGATLAGTYRIERMLGEGGMGRVYEARHVRIAAKLFAVKVLHPELVRNPEALLRFDREVEAAARIESAHVVGVQDVGRTPDGRPFMVSELCQGEDLANRLTRAGRMGAPLAVRIARQVCAGLAEAHARGIVHRDIKPENVFLVGDPAAPTAKILDFGISRVTDAERTKLTRTGLIMGTPAYMAPEQARGDPTDARTDVYAVGAMLYVSLTGRLPFERDDPTAAVVAVLTEEPPPPRGLAPELSEHLEMIVQRAMAKDPATRHASALELGEALAPYDMPAAISAAAPTDPLRPAARAATLPSHARLEREMAEAALARPLLVALFGTAALGGALAVVLTVGGVLRAVGVELGGVGWALLTLGVLGTMSTPLVLAAARVRARAWGNTARAVEVARAMRAPVAAGIACYGLAWLLVRFVETVVRGEPLGVARPGWDALVGGFALAAAGLGAWIERFVRRGARERGVAAALAVAFGVGLVGAVALVAAGGAPSAEVSGGALAPPAAPSAPSAAPVVASAAATADPERASADELAAARKEGAFGLERLAERRPRDAAVLRAWIEALGPVPRAMEVAARLLDIEPGAAGEERVRAAVAAGASGTAAQIDVTLSLCAAKMGSAGPDLLFDVAQQKPALRARAQALLATPEVRARATPALRIALELREASACATKMQLLDRAVKEGDERSAGHLQTLVVGTAKGCGFLGVRPCPATCAAQAKEMRAAIEAIRAR
jgi:serine/threonine-protein kinase